MGFTFLRWQFFDNGVGKILFDERNFFFGKNNFYIDAGFIIRQLGFFHLSVDRRAAPCPMTAVMNPHREFGPRSRADAAGAPVASGHGNSTALRSVFAVPIPAAPVADERDPASRIRALRGRTRPRGRDARGAGAAGPPPFS